MSTSKLFEVDEDAVLGQVLKIFDQTKEDLLQIVSILKEWLKNQPYFPQIMDDRMLQNFVINSNCSIEVAKQRVDLYYTLRSRLQHVCKNPKLPEVKQVMEASYIFLPLPKLTKEMNRIFICKVRKRALVEDIEPYDTLSHIVNISEIRLREDIAFGDIFIIDYKVFSFKQVRKFTPTVTYILVMIYETMLSSNLKAMYMINSSTCIEAFGLLLKSFLKPELADKVQICKGTSLLERDFSKEVLPKDYGGEEKSLEELQGLVKLKFMEYQEIFDQLDHFSIDENLKNALKLENDEHLGFYGNFKTKQH